MLSRPSEDCFRLMLMKCRRLPMARAVLFYPHFRRLGRCCFIRTSGGWGGAVLPALPMAGVVLLYPHFQLYFILTSGGWGDAVLSSLPVAGVVLFYLFIVRFGNIL